MSATPRRGAPRQQQASVASQATLEALRLTPGMIREFNAVTLGHGRYWPNGREITSLLALARRGLVRFVRGYGWRLTEQGHQVAQRYGVAPARPNQAEGQP